MTRLLTVLSAGVGAARWGITLRKSLSAMVRHLMADQTMGNL